MCLLAGTAPGGREYLNWTSGPRVQVVGSQSHLLNGVSFEYWNRATEQKEHKNHKHGERKALIKKNRVRVVNTFFESRYAPRSVRLNLDFLQNRDIRSSE
ncbi:hypothetical protein AVEN_20631-1 [Araneus ventricosus]|uniref:Uncharacterized protein n=1 Tax=Araneus ventricosus TaxID=182803 RepID=A0A4Y2V995_ARAVE|nr:hypothetical protein AVEN_20631-1 [Araneus ventricosus]